MCLVRLKRCINRIFAYGASEQVNPQSSKQIRLTCLSSNPSASANSGAGARRAGCGACCYLLTKRDVLCSERVQRINYASDLSNLQFDLMYLLVSLLDSSFSLAELCAKSVDCLLH